MGILNGKVPLSSLSLKDDGLPSDSSIVQKQIEETVLKKFIPYAPNNKEKKSLESVKLTRAQHISYLEKGLEGIAGWAAAMDASKPWIVYWILHSLDLLGHKFSPTFIQRAISTLNNWQLPTGGFAGGSDQLAHLAPTYAAVNAVAIIGTKEAYAMLDRKGLYDFLMKMKQPDGSFTMHKGGEIDIRGVYCALSIATLTNLLTPEIQDKSADFIARSQTYEGGIAPYPNKEAHNGYAFCGLAAMEILGSMSTLNMDKLMNWCCQRQMSLEGGFQGRTNKLVDGCYSFWGAGDFPIIKAELDRGLPGDSADDYLFDREALQEYLLLCCQSKSGGMIDKPGKGPDYYHTCYCLSGLSTAQHSIYFDIDKAAKLKQEMGIDVSKGGGGIGSLMWKDVNKYVIVGDVNNMLEATHPIHNITLRATRDILHHFYEKELHGIEQYLAQDDELLVEE